MKIDKFLAWALDVAPVDYASELDEHVAREGRDITSPLDLRLSVHQAITCLDTWIVGLTRLRGYLEGWRGQVGHRESVRLSNHLVAGVRKALGYVNPRQDLQF